MGILDWFKSRPSFFEPDRLSDDTTTRAIEKAVTLTNPRMKLIHSYRERLAPDGARSSAGPIGFVRELVHRPGVESFLCCCTGYSFHDGPIKKFAYPVQQVPGD